MTRSVEQHSPSKACTLDHPTKPRPDMDYRVCRLAGIRFGNPSVARSSRLPRAVVIGLALTVVPTGTEYHRRVP